MHAVRAAGGLAQPKKLMSNGAMAAVLASFVGLSYYWSMHSVGSTDLEKEVALEVRHRRIPCFCIVDRLSCCPRVVFHPQSSINADTCAAFCVHLLQRI